MKALHKKVALWLIAGHQYPKVSRIYQMVAVVLMIFWAPITSHCLLENIEVIHNDEHCHESASGHGHDAADGLCKIESGGYQIQKKQQSDLLSLAYLLSPLISWTQEFNLNAASRYKLDSSPPELQTSWQFSSRAALPARAPSIASN